VGGEFVDLGLVIAIGLTIGAASVAFLAWAVVTPRFARYRISDDPHRAIDDMTLYKTAAKSAVFSASLIFAAAFALQSFLFYRGPVSVWRVALEAVTVILIYDFLYYFMHRYLLHEWRTLRGAHAVHHAAQNPRVIDALLLHPLETFLGLASLFVSILMVGGIHLYTFAPIFAAYTTLNVFNHAGVALPWFPFKTIGILAIKHDRHHHSMLSGNYASITPLPDYVFGTLE
jgi:sterol desaturase/sphingolipid hydroxylase (fatty acid hydroxylase superfamily)